MKIQTRVTPFLGYRSQAAEAAELYVGLVPDSRIVRTVRNPADPEKVMLVEFELGGLPLCAFNTGQDWPFTTAFSLSVACESQQEIDRLWAALSAGGQEVQCGWLTDRYGVSWQIVPAQLGDWMSDPDAARAGRVMAALFQMVKLDVAKLQAAYEQA